MRRSEMKSNICFVSLNNTFTKSVANSFASYTDMYFADIEELMQFDLIDVANAMDICGIEYIKKIEHGKIKNVCTYDNTCVSVNYEMLNDEINCNALKEHCTTIMIDFSLDTFKCMQPKQYDKINKNNIDLDLFHSRQKILKSNVDIVVHYMPSDKNLNKKIMTKLMDYYKKK